MKTATAIQLHSALGLVQAGAGAVHFPWWGQLLVQATLLLLQGTVAHANSVTGPNGEVLSGMNFPVSGGGN